MTLCNNTAETEPTAVQAKRKTILENWDKRRVGELGDEAGSWEVLYCSTGQVCFFLCSFFFFFCFFVFLSSPFISLNSISLADPKIAPLYAPQGGQMRQVRCDKTELKDVHVPFFELPPTWTRTLSSHHQPHVKLATTKKSVEEEEALEDRNRKIGELFEWLGMACLGSQRFSFLFFFFFCGVEI